MTSDWTAEHETEDGSTDPQVMPMALYHMTTRKEADDAAVSGEYRPSAFDREGFIHCSYRHQVQAVANRLFPGRGDLVLLEIDRDLLECDVVEENIEGGRELFPHVYGPLPMSAVVRVHDIVPDIEGRFELFTSSPDREGETGWKR